MSRVLLWVVVGSVAALRVPALASGPDADSAGHEATVLHRRVGISAGMGVSYMNPPDIIDVVNSVAGSYNRVSEFKSGVEFFGDASFTVSGDWQVKLEYAYLLATFNVEGSFGPAEFSIMVHMPTLMVQYILVDEGIYNIKIGGGAGYHIGILSEKYGTLDDRFTGKGLGVALDAEGNTALGENLFAYLGVDGRWDFIGALENQFGRGASVFSRDTRPTLTFFGLGARLGLTYYF